MAKVIKEIIIMLVICLLTMLVLAIALYRYIPNRKTGIAANQNTRIFLKQQKLRMIYIKVRINDAKITYQNPLKKSSSKYQIVIKFAVITAIHCNIINFNFFLSSFIPDPPAKYQFLYS